jgi:hypothetical protein
VVTGFEKSEGRAATPSNLFLPSNHRVASVQRELSEKAGEGPHDVYVETHQLTEIHPRNPREEKADVTI